MKNIIIILLALTIAHQAMKEPIEVATAESCQALAVDTLSSGYDSLLVQAKELF